MCRTHAGGTPLALQVYANIQCCCAPEMQRSEELHAKICNLLHQYAKGL